MKSNPNYRPLHALISNSLYETLHTRSHQLEVSKAHIVRAALRQYLGTRTIEQTKEDVEQDINILFGEE